MLSWVCLFYLYIEYMSGNDPELLHKSLIYAAAFRFLWCKGGDCVGTMSCNNKLLSGDQQSATETFYTVPFFTAFIFNVNIYY